MRKSKVEEKQKADESAIITAYKAFDKNFQCRGFQYAVGEIYTHVGEIAMCQQGFHACVSPFDIFNYYQFLETRFAVVELSGQVIHENKDSSIGKCVAQTIKIVKELTFAEMVTAQHSFATGHADGKSTSAGNGSTAASAGYDSTAASAGEYSIAASAGEYSTAASAGDCSTAASAGEYSKAASSGDCSTAACDTTGFAMVAGTCGQVKGGQGSALSLGYVDIQHRNRIAVGYVGEDGIKPGVWYRVDAHGKFSEVNS